MKNIVLGLTGFTLAITNIVLKGWVVSMLWLLFIVPITGLPAIDICQGIGIGLIISFVTYRLDIDNYKFKELKLNKMQKGLIKQIAMLLISITFFIFGFVIYKINLVYFP